MGVLAREMPKVPIVPIGLISVFDVWPWNRKWPKFFGRKIVLRVGTSNFFEDSNQKPQQFTDLVMMEVKKLLK